MKCPIDGTELKIAERQGVEIDYCPQCRGVWLDRGELDKIIERADAYDQRDRSREHQDDQAAHRTPSGGAGTIAGIVGEVLKEGNGRKRDERYRDERYRDERYRDERYSKKKKGGILGELFDF